jgi:probable F420-dependent oxidoreductase
MVMKFGIVFANTGPFAGPDGALAIARAAEQAGFESLWTVEHVFVPKGYESEYPYDKSGRMPGTEDAPIPDPLIWLSFLASATSTIKLGTGILIVPQRNPVVLAKECATLDVLSGGRLLLGVGAGWLEEEFDAIGVPFKNRGRRLDDHIAAMRALWSDGASSFAGEFTTFADGYSYPKPPGGTIPVVIGGHSDAAAKRAGRLGDGFFPGRGSNASLAGLFATMREAAEAAGRDPSAIELTTGGAAAFAPDPVEALGELAEMGVSRVVIPPLAYNLEALPDALAQFGENVIAKLT